MKITLFTSNKLRHQYLIKLLANFSENLFVIQEEHPILSGNNKESVLINEYFENVNFAQEKLFKLSLIKQKKLPYKLLNIMPGEINNLNLASIKDFLNSDLYIVFGSSYIKGDLINLLIKRKAVNIHMGVSPYYRGTDCNFWALYDNRPHLVGATIHYLSKGLDSGDILYHALAKPRKNIFEYTMSSVKSAFYSLEERIKNESIFKIKSIKQDQSKELRYSRNIDFNEGNLKKFLSKKIILDEINFDENLLINPFFY